MYMKRVEIKVKGNVQGVFFRQTAKNMAEIWGITGWVKNEHDGTVNIVAEGDVEQLKKMVDWAKQGYSPASVHSIDEKWTEASKEFGEFSVKY